MDSAIIIHRDRLGYSIDSASDIAIEILATFLISDVSCYWPSFKEWLNEKYEETSSNATWLKKVGDTIHLGSLYSDEPDGGPFLVMPKSQYIHILDEWEKVCKTKPKEIMITKEGEKFSLQIIQ